MESLAPWVLLAAGAALVFAVLSRLFGGRRAALRFGVLLLVFFGTAYLTLRAGWGDFLDPLASRPALLHGAATCWWITAAYTANAALRRWVWHGVLLVGGKPAVPRLLTNLVSAFLYLVAIMVVLYFVYEKPITGVAAASGVLVFLIGYSAQPTLGELFAGIALNFSRPFEPGDSVIVGDVEGTVMDIDWRSVSILSLPGNLTVIPNSQAAGSTIVNYDRPSATVLRHLEFEADYGVAPVRVSEVVRAAMEHAPSVLEAPPPMVFTLGFGELGVRYRAIWFIGSIERDRWSSQTQVASGIWHAMHRAGIRFSFHRRQLYSGDPQDEALLPAARPQPDRFTLFRSVRLFDALSDAEVESLAERAERRDFGPPERIVREGEEGESMFVIAGGHVEVTVGGEGGAQVHTAELGPGANVGSMSLLTGEPRSATVRALDEVVVYEIEKVAMQEVFEANPETLERIGRTVAEWAAENEQKLLDHRLSQQEAAQRAQSLIVAMVSRVRAFFAAAPRREAAPRGEGFDHRLGEPEHAAQLPDETDPSRAAAEERS